MRTCSECPRRFKPKRPHHVCCSQECRSQRMVRLQVEEAQAALQRVSDGTGSRGGNVRSIQEARDLQEVHKPEWSARIREHIARTLLETGFFHADDLDVLQVPVAHCNLKGAQIGGFRARGLMLKTGTERVVSHPAANWRKAPVFRISAKGRRVAVIFDSKANRTFRIYRKGSRFFHLGMPRAAARVAELRSEGHSITSESEGKFCRYTLLDGVGVGADSGGKIRKESLFETPVVEEICVDSGVGVSAGPTRSPGNAGLAGNDPQASADSGNSWGALSPLAPQEARLFDGYEVQEAA
jgi:hypothetical protein